MGKWSSNCGAARVEAQPTENTVRGAESSASEIFFSPNPFCQNYSFIWRVCLRGGLHTRVTSIPACFRILRSDLEAPRSVMTACRADVGTIRERLRCPNLLESQTAIVRLATSTITRLTLASRRLGVLS